MSVRTEMVSYVQPETRRHGFESDLEIFFYTFSFLK